MTGSCERVRRARPLLGTLVEIVLEGGGEPVLQRAATRAFDAMERVHRLMSFHSETSDVTRLNRRACFGQVEVDRETWRVLELAYEVSLATGGAFDVTVGARMMERGALPRMVSGPFDPDATFRDIELLSGHRVCFRRPLAVDLGGIAKGHAVDRAVEVLRENQDLSGWVNAGGDMRAFGVNTVPVQVRNPHQPLYAGALALLHDNALATTANYSARSGLATAGVILDPLTSTEPQRFRSASVRAATCAVADALAKSVFLLRERAGTVLAQFGAAGFLLDDKGLSMIGTQT
jgi:FAD:protein FMN transferase